MKNEEYKIKELYISYHKLQSKEETEGFGVRALGDILQITDHTLPPAGRGCGSRRVQKDELERFSFSTGFLL